MVSFTKQEIETLTKILTERFEANWSTCDKNKQGTLAYSKASDECDIIKGISKKLQIGFPESIASRF